MRYPIALILAAALVAACDNTPGLVYIPVEPPVVELQTAVSSAEVRVNEAVSVHVARRYRGQWKAVARGDLQETQCWLTRPPPEFEPEVADKCVG